MSGSWSPAAVATLNCTAGGTGPLGTGAFTIAVLFQAVTGNNNAGLVDMLATSTVTRASFMDSLHMFGTGDFSDGFPATALSLNTWYLGIISKASGSTTYRWAVWPYASDGSGTMTQGTSNNSGNHGDGSAITNIKIGIGEGSVRGNGLIACTAFWDRQISQAEELTMKSANLQAWYDVSGGPPLSIVSLENWNGTTGLSDLVGSISLSSVTGSVSSGSNPPSFNFSVSAGGSNVTASDSPQGIRWRSGAEVGIAVNGIVSDSALGYRWRSTPSEVVTIAVTAADAASGFTLRSATETVVTAVTALDGPGGWRWNAPSGESTVLGTAVPDVPSGLRWSSAPDLGVVANTLIGDSALGIRWRSADGSGVVLGTAVTDVPSGWRLGAPPDAVTYAVVVSDTPNGMRWLSGDATVFTGGPVTLADLVAGYRWRSGAERGVDIAAPPAVDPGDAARVVIDRFTSRVLIDRLASVTTIDKLP